MTIFLPSDLQVGRYFYIHKQKNIKQHFHNIILNRKFADENQKQKMNRNIKHILFHFKWFFATVIFVIFSGFVGESCMLNRWAQRREISRLKDEIETYQKKFNEDKKTIKRLKEDPEAIVEVARERYFMKTPQEDIFIIEDKHEKK